ncbi:hypothetical protein [Flavobacterium pallidum]|nr:hypothetical protein [Flavobacterium pallidum]
MKRLFLMLTVIATAAMFHGCQGDDGAPGPEGPAGPNSLVFEILQQDFVNSADGYRIYGTFANEIGGNLFDAETILIYRLSGTIDAQTPIWQLIPRTIYLDTGEEVDYDYDFSLEDFAIYCRGTNLSASPEFLNDQTFRVVIIPGTFTNRNAAKTVDYNDYNAVIKAYGIDDSHVGVVKPQRKS